MNAELGGQIALANTREVLRRELVELLLRQTTLDLPRLVRPGRLVSRRNSKERGEPPQEVPVP